MNSSDVHILIIRENVCASNYKVYTFQDQVTSQISALRRQVSTLNQTIMFTLNRLEQRMNHRYKPSQIILKEQTDTAQGAIPSSSDSVPDTQVLRSDKSNTEIPMTQNITLCLLS